MKVNICIVVLAGMFSFGSFGNAVADINDGLIADYPFNGNANDESGNGNNGTVYEAVLTTDRFGNLDSAYSFDGVDDYIDIGNNVKPAIPATVSAWVNINSQGSNGIFGNDSWTTWDYNGIHITINSEGRVICGIGGPGGGSSSHRRSKITDESLIQVDDWYQIVCVINAYNDMQIFVNAVEPDGTYDGSGTQLTYSSDNGAIGKAYSGSSIANGKIDDVIIYERALSVHEIKELYFMGVARYFDIKANNSDGPIGIPLGDNLSITVEFNPGDKLGDNADRFVLADTPFGWYYYHLSLGWLPGQVCTLMSPLDYVYPSAEVLNRSDLPDGTYTFYFGVDMNMNCQLEVPHVLGYDSVKVILKNGN